jgi:hypothetical protein
MAPLLFVPQMLFVGFFISTSNIPIFLRSGRQPLHVVPFHLQIVLCVFTRWAQYLCSLKYSMNIVLLSEFSSSNKSCQVKKTHQICMYVCMYVCMHNGQEVSNFQINIFVLFFTYEEDFSAFKTFILCLYIQYYVCMYVCVA